MPTSKTTSQTRRKTKKIYGPGKAAPKRTFKNIKRTVEPAVTVLKKRNSEVMDQIEDAPAVAGAKPLVIGIDGNEANVSKRVGANTYAYHLLSTLHRIGSRHKFIVYLRDEPLPDMPPADEHWQYKVIPMARLWTQIRLPMAVFTSNPKPDIFFNPGHYISPLLPMPVVISIMDLAFLTHPQYFEEADLNKLTRGTKLSASKAAHIFTISQHSKNDIRKFYQFPDSNITVTYPGIDHNIYTFPQSDLEINRVKRLYNLSDNYLLYVGTLQPRKNLINLIKGFALLKNASYQLVIAGKKGWMYEDIFQHVRDQQVEDRIIFTDFVPQTDLPPLMAGARALALVSLYEGFGIPVIEAAAVGTPSIVSSVSSLPEILGNAGITVDPNQAEDIARGMEYLINLPDKEYYELTDKAIAHAHQFNWEQTSRKTLEILEQVAG